MVCGESSFKLPTPTSHLAMNLARRLVDEEVFGERANTIIARLNLEFVKRMKMDKHILLKEGNKIDAFRFISIILMKRPDLHIESFLDEKKSRLAYFQWVEEGETGKYITLSAEEDNAYLRQLILHLQDKIERATDENERMSRDLMSSTQRSNSMESHAHALSSAMDSKKLLMDEQIVILRQMNKDYFGTTESKEMIINEQISVLARINATFEKPGTPTQHRDPMSSATTPSSSVLNSPWTTPAATPRTNTNLERNVNDEAANSSRNPLTNWQEVANSKSQLLSSQEDEINEMRVRLRQRDAHINDLQQQLENAREDLAEMRHYLHGLESSQGSRKNDVDTQSGRPMFNLEKELKRLRNIEKEYAIIQEDNSRNRAEIRNLKTEASVLKTERETVEKLLKSKSDEILKSRDSMDEFISAKSNELDGLRSSLRNTEANKMQLQQEVRDLKDRLESQQIQFEQKMVQENRERRTLETEIIGLRRLLEERAESGVREKAVLREKIGTLSSQRASELSAAYQWKSQQKEETLEGYDRMLDQLSERVDNFWHQAEEQLQMLRSMGRGVGGIEERGSYRSNQRWGTDEEEQEEEENARIRDYVRQIDSLAASFKSSQAERRDLQSQIGLMERQLQNLHGNESQLTRDLQNAEKKAREMEEFLAECQAVFKEEKEELRTSKHLLMIELEGAQKELSALRRVHAALNENHSSEKEEISRLQGLVETLTEAVQLAEEKERRNAAQSRDDVAAAENNFRYDLSQAEDAASRSRKDLEAMRVAMELQEREVNKIMEDELATRSVVAQLKETNEKLRAEIHAYSDTVAMKEASLAQLRDESQAVLRTTVEEYDNRIAEYEKELSMMEDTVKKHRTQVEALELQSAKQVDQIDQRSNQIEILKRETKKRELEAKELVTKLQGEHKSRENEAGRASNLKQRNEELNLVIFDLRQQAASQQTQARDTFKKERQRIEDEVRKDIERQKETYEKKLAKMQKDFQFEKKTLLAKLSKRTDASREVEDIWKQREKELQAVIEKMEKELQNAAATAKEAEVTQQSQASQLVSLQRDRDLLEQEGFELREQLTSLLETLEKGPPKVEESQREEVVEVMAEESDGWEAEETKTDNETTEAGAKEKKKEEREKSVNEMAL
jgi:chromosome segregation ATPase